MSDSMLFEDLPEPNSGGIALARKWRPRDFKTLVGQDHVVKALTHALDQNRLHHAWLFTGTRGVGKTTISRILAKSLNCTGTPDNPVNSPTSEPCGKCPACTEIDAGRFVDYVEMDAASNRGIGDMVALLEKAIYGPTSGRYKVYMIDEVHMLTSQAFNSMLKTLEEPPPHMKFILATTDPQKIPVTVLSRCLQFNLKQMPSSLIVDYLSKVLEQEQISAQTNALRIVAKAARGSMRDALSLTDQAIAYASGEITEASVRAMLGTLDDAYLVRILDALQQKNGAELITISSEMGLMSMSFNMALQDLSALLQKIAMAQVIPESVLEEWPEAPEIQRLANSFSREEIQLFYQIAITSRADLILAPEEEAGFLMALLRMLAFRPDDGGGAPIRAVNPTKSQYRAEPELGASLDSKSKDIVIKPEMSSELVVPKDWQHLVNQLQLKGLVGQFAKQTAISSWSNKGDTVYIELHNSVPQIATTISVQKFSEALSNHLGKKVKLSIIELDSEHTVAKLEERDKSDFETHVRQQLDVDPFLGQMKKELGVVLIEGSIQPIVPTNN